MKQQQIQTQQTLSWGTPFCFLTTLTFLVLKLCHIIDWNWWWIFAPLWLPIAVSLIVITIFILVVAIARPNRWRKK